MNHSFDLLDGVIPAGVVVILAGDSCDKRWACPSFILQVLKLVQDVNPDSKGTGDDRDHVDVSHVKIREIIISNGCYELGEE